MDGLVFLAHLLYSLSVLFERFTFNTVWDLSEMLGFAYCCAFVEKWIAQEIYLVETLLVIRNLSATLETVSSFNLLRIIRDPLWHRGYFENRILFPFRGLDWLGIIIYL